MEPYDHLFKIVLVGDNEVGKTSIYLRYFDDIFNSSPRSSPLIDDFKIRLVEIYGKVIKLQIWDTQGIERFRTLTPTYYRGTHGAVIVYDITDQSSWYSVRRWIDEVVMFATEAEMLIVGNKCDLSNLRYISKDQTEEFADSYGIDLMETSAKDNINVEEAFVAIAKNIMKKMDTKINIDIMNIKIGKDDDAPGGTDKTFMINLFLAKLLWKVKKNVEKENKKILMQNLNKAKRDHGTIPVRFLKIIVAGSGAAGKTNFINLLMRRNYKKEHHSTNVVQANHAVSFRMATFQQLSEVDNEVTWIEFDSELEISYLQSVLLAETSPKQALPVLTTETDTAKAIATPVSTNTPVNPQYQSKVLKHQRSTFFSWFAGLFTGSIKDSKLNAVDSILNSKSSHPGASIYHIGSVLNIITLLDTGGQPQYIHLLPTININPTITFVIHNLAKNLDDQVLVEYSQHSKHMFAPYHLSYTNMDMIKFLLSSVNDSIERRTSDLQLVVTPGTDDKSYICMVGTHADKITHSKKEGVGKKITSLVNKTQCHAAVWYHKNENILFSVDNTTAGSKYSEDPVAKDIRSRIETLASKKEIYDLPITWMLLQLEIRQRCSKQGKSYILFSDCVAIAKTSGLISNKEEVKSVLLYHHLLGILIYFHEIPGLCDYVIVDHQWWFDKLSSVICITFQEDCLNYQAVQKLKYQGILSKELVKHVEWKDDIKEEFFFSLLIHLKIITPLHSQQNEIEEYFIPFVLSAYNLQHENKILSQYGYLQGKPLLFQFHSGLLPRGFFCSLLVQLLQCPFEGSEPHFSQEGKHHAFSNLFAFSLPNAYTISLLDKLSYLEVQIRHPEKAFDIPVHAQVYNYMKHVLTDVCNHLKFNFERLQCGFLCKCCKCTEDHIAIVQQISSLLVYAKCTIDTTCQMKLDSSHLVWFSYDQHTQNKSVDICHTDDLLKDSSSNKQMQEMKRPNMRLLHEIVVPRIAADWSMVADFLEYDVQYKRLIREKCFHDPQRCCVELLEDWLSSNRGVSPKSWQKLIEVLRGIRSLKAVTETIVEDLATAGVNV